MLSELQKQAIRDDGLLTLHDHSFMAMAHGEPFLVAGHLIYHDGITLTVCGYPLRSSPAVPPHRLVRRACREPDLGPAPRYVVFLGPLAPDSLALLKDGWCLVGASDHPLSTELAVGSWIVEGSRTTRLYRQAARKLERWTQTVTDGAGWTARHLELLRSFVARREKALRTYGSLPELALSARSLSYDPGTRLISLYAADELCGFCVNRQPFRDVGIGYLLVTDPRFRSADAMIAASLQLAFEEGCTLFNLGPSATSGQWRFKSKWRATALAPPSSTAVFSRGRIDALAMQNYWSGVLSPAASRP